MKLSPPQFATLDTWIMADQPTYPPTNFNPPDIAGLIIRAYNHWVSLNNGDKKKTLISEGGVYLGWGRVG